jgi:hypothetical protein
VLGGTGDLLADDRTHRAAHEPEVHDADRDVPSVDRAGSPDGGVAQARGELRRRDAVGVRLLVDESQGVERLEAGVVLAERGPVEEEIQAGRGR